MALCYNIRMAICSEGNESKLLKRNRCKAYTTLRPTHHFFLQLLALWEKTCIRTIMAWVGLNDYYYHQQNVLWQHRKSQKEAYFLRLSPHKPAQCMCYTRTVFVLNQGTDKQYALSQVIQNMLNEALTALLLWITLNSALSFLCLSSCLFIAMPEEQDNV